MKFIFLSLFLLSVKTHAQSNENSDQSVTRTQQEVNNVKTYGYVGGVRLDSIDANYAEFNIRWLSREVTFDYGQEREKKRDLLITDEKGNPLQFKSLNIAFLLNFFHFNKWQLAEAFSTTNSGSADTFVLKKN